MTILNQTVEQLITGYKWAFYPSIGSYIGLIILTLAVSGTAIAIIFAIKEDEAAYLFWLILTILIIGITIFAVFHHDIKTDIIQYEVTIDDSISFNEIMNKYEYIDHRGNIYILKDKLPEGHTNE